MSAQPSHRTTQPDTKSALDPGTEPRPAVTSAMAPAFRWLRAGLHLLMLVCAAVALVPALRDGSVQAWIGSVAVIGFVIAWAGGAVEVERGKIRHGTVGVYMGLTSISVAWAVAASQIPEGAYLVFPLFFAFLFLLGMEIGTAAVVVATAVAVLFLSRHHGFSYAQLIGPALGAAVSVLIGWALRAVVEQAAVRESLLRRLLKTQRELTASQHEAGEQTERARLAGEIHDGVSQSLSSIQMLLHAAERGMGEMPEQAQAREYVVLARTAAEEAQAETRDLLRRMAPAAMAEETLTGALERMAHVGAGPAVTVSSDEPPLTMSQQTSLFRIAQGALGNARLHARAHRVAISLEHDDRLATLTVGDDGQGFEPQAAPAGLTGRGHFGLGLMRERAEQLGGELAVRSSPGQGTTVMVRIPLDLEAVDHDDDGADKENK